MNGQENARIAEINKKMMIGVAQQDLNSLVSLYSEQAKIVPFGSDALVGTAAIREYWENTLKGGLAKLTLETLELSSGGGNEYLRELGEAKLEIRQGEEPIHISTKYVVLWKLENSVWKIDTDIMF